MAWEWMSNTPLAETSPANPPPEAASDSDPMCALFALAGRVQ